jgi:outer membrane protein TolC
MMKKNVLVVFLVLMGITFSFAGSAKAEKLTPKGDMLQEIIDLVVENNPTLQSQKSLLDQIQALPDPGKGFDFQLNVRGGMTVYVDENSQEIWAGPTGGVVLEMPLFSSSRRRESIMSRLTYAKELEKARQDYLALKNSIVSELLTKLKKLFQLENEKKKLEQLKSFLSSNSESLEQQAKTGVIKAADLWQLSERIMDIETKIYNQSSELEILRREIAINLGGEKSSQLWQMLEQLSVKDSEEKRLESQ